MDALAGKVAVVTGAASGIGLALAERFVAEGMKVVLADIDDTGISAVEAALTARGGDVMGVHCDASLADSVDHLAQRTIERYGAAHLLCNNAGVPGRGNAWTGPLAEWDWVLGINLYGVIHGVRAFLPIMSAQGEGHIVNTASMAGLTALPGAVPYGVSKHGVVALSEGLYLELQMLGSPVGVSCLCPAFVRTGLMSSRWNARHGDEPTAASDEVAAMVFDLLRTGVDGGIAPDVVAGAVVSAIRIRQFWILTHPESRRAPIARMRRAARQEDPSPGPESAHPELARVLRKVRARRTRAGTAPAPRR